MRFPDGSAPTCSAPQSAIMAYTDDLVLAGGRVPDMCRALRLEFDDVEERICEIVAPDGVGTFDIMRDISRSGDR